MPQSIGLDCMRIERILTNGLQPVARPTRVLYCSDSLFAVPCLPVRPLSFIVVYLAPSTEPSLFNPACVSEVVTEWWRKLISSRPSRLTRLPQACASLSLSPTSQCIVGTRRAVVTSAPYARILLHNSGMMPSPDAACPVSPAQTGRTWLYFHDIPTAFAPTCSAHLIRCTSRSALPALRAKCSITYTCGERDSAHCPPPAGGELFATVGNNSKSANVELEA